MPRIAHSKRPRALRNKRNRQILLDAWLTFKEKNIQVRDIERQTGIGVGTVSSILQGKAKIDQVTVILIAAIAKDPSIMREIELMWEGYSIEEITMIRVHES